MRLFDLLLLSLLVVTGCTGLPKGVQPAGNFDLNRYLGKWYEIARLDHSFERGLENVTADYSLRDDGGVRVINRGYSTDNQEWKQAEGKAYFVGDPDVGRLKVSFFGPFYGSYVVFELDKAGYQHAFVSGPSHSYLWLLARTPAVSAELMERFVERSGELGFSTNKLIWVNQSPVVPPEAE